MKLVTRLNWALGFLCLALGVAVCSPPPHRILPVVPDNVSADATGKAPPILSIPPGEKVESVAVANEAGEAVDWSVESLGAKDAWDKGFTGKGVKVFVLDTGVMTTHRDLKDAIKWSKDFTRSPFGVEDKNGHGTHCAGSIGARKNGWGLTGVAYECDLGIGKVLGDSGSGGVDGIRDGILWAVAQGADVISMSLGGAGSDDMIPVGLKAAEEAGVIVVVAAGNDGNGRPVNFPAAYPECIAVSAVDSRSVLANFSCTGPKVEVCGPGVKVRSTYPGAGDGLFADLSGTSMATPNVAGLAALWVQAAAGVPKKDRAKGFRAWLAKAGSCKDLGAVGRDSQYGWGLPVGGKVSGEAPAPPKPGKSLTLTEKDLTADAQKKLAEAGWDTFTLTLTGKGSAEVPQVSFSDLFDTTAPGDSRIVFWKVPGDLTQWPSGVALKDLPDGQDFPPGVYEVRKKPILSFSPVK